MIPAAFDYVLAEDDTHALSLLAKYGEDGKLLAGGHSLIPLLRFRLASPSVLIDIGRLSYREVEVGDAIVRLGALATHSRIERNAPLRERLPLFAEAGMLIGDVQVRNRGTIGGALAHADPAADWPAVLLATGAFLTIISPTGTREVDVDAFFTDLYTTDLRQDEILTSISVPYQSGVGSAYKKCSNPASGYAVVGIGATLTLDGDVIASCRLGATGISNRPQRLHAVEQRLVGTCLDNDSWIAALRDCGDGLELAKDAYADERYREQLLNVYIRRCVSAAVADAVRRRDL